MNRIFRAAIISAILGIATVPACMVSADLAPQAPDTQQHPAGVPHSWQGKPGGVPPQGAHSPAATAQAAPAAPIHPTPVGMAAPGKKTASGEQFFIVASIDLQKSQLLLKYPTEVTLLVVVSGATKFVDETEKPLKLADFRAGDTVWMVSSPAAQGEATAIHVRKGQMTVADLHRYYLDYDEIK